MNSSHPYNLIVGLDRSDAKSDLCLIDPQSRKILSQYSISTAPESLESWVHQLRQEHPDGQIAICFEQPASNLICFFTQFAFFTLFAINPISLLKFRETFVTSRAKDDTLDSKFLALLILDHHEHFQAWNPEDPKTRLLQRLVIDRRNVVNHRTELSNRLKALLKAYFPQALELAGDELWRPLGTAFLLKWPTLQGWLLF